MKITWTLVCLIFLVSSPAWALDFVFTGSEGSNSATASVADCQTLTSASEASDMQTFSYEFEWNALEVSKLTDILDAGGACTIPYTTSINYDPRNPAKPKGSGKSSMEGFAKISAFVSVVDTDGTVETTYESTGTTTGLCAGDCTDPTIPASTYSTTATKGTKTKGSHDLTGVLKTVVDYVPLGEMDYIKVLVSGYSIAYARCNSISQDRPTATASAALKGTITCSSP